MKNNKIKIVKSDYINDICDLYNYDIDKDILFIVKIEFGKYNYRHINRLLYGISLYRSIGGKKI